MAFGLGRLGLAPDDFWAMTPRELAAAAQSFGGDDAAPMSRGRFADLMQRYPDKEPDDG